MGVTRDAERGCGEAQETRFRKSSTSSRCVSGSSGNPPPARPGGSAGSDRPTDGFFIARSSAAAAGAAIFNLLASSTERTADDTAGSARLTVRDHAVVGGGYVPPLSCAWMPLVCLLFCSRLASVGGAPVCAQSQAGCRVLSLAELFDRVIQHSARTHSFSNDLHSDFVSLHNLCDELCWRCLMNKFDFMKGYLFNKCDIWTVVIHTHINV
ncbi:hypothetical protein EYF80_061527 [Liparis tanakae]|uniref:Uncharacterized protein n=1 Tax=Liparis tanakae TaxID=230148 RepID=A0A4Z2EHP2_9TELE|nr:hypothetical protein EYF80_061527 [Liparis tanakae]